MKAVLCIFSAVALLFGCSKSEVKPEIHEPVSGAFGWKLGDRLPDFLSSQISNIGFDRQFTLQPTGLFDSVDLFLTKSNLIYTISASSSSHPDKEQVKLLVDSLRDKYGDYRGQIDKSRVSYQSWDFGGEGRIVSLCYFTNSIGTGTINLYYTDIELQSLSSKEKREDSLLKKTQEVRSELPNL